MLRTFNSMKYQKSISYYTEDIECWESGEYACTGFDDDGDGTYDITFEQNGTTYLIIEMFVKSHSEGLKMPLLLCFTIDGTIVRNNTAKG